MTKSDIILAGVGGQGILSVATIVGHAAVRKNLHLKQAETHGMSQRGGDVQSHLRISEHPIASDLIPYGRANLVLSGEIMEGLRYLPYLAPDGYLVTSSNPIKNIPNYPDVDELIARVKAYPRHIILDADQIAREAGSARASNVVMLGAAAAFIITDMASLEQGIVDTFQRKGDDVVQANIKALRAGYEYSKHITAG